MTTEPTSPDSPAPISPAADDRLFSFCETVVEMALLFARKETHPKNSFDLHRLCIEWAECFEARNAGREWDGEWIDEVGTFFEAQYAEWLANDYPETV